MENTEQFNAPGGVYNRGRALVVLRAVARSLAMRATARAVSLVARARAVLVAARARGTQ